MLALRTIALCFITYAIIALVLFGDVLTPVFLATVWSDHLGAPYWFWIVIAWFAIGASSFRLPDRFSLVHGPIFISVALLGSLMTVGFYADTLRSSALKEFKADRQLQHSFLESVRHAPEEYQFYLHAAAMKHCKPYMWSYQTMSLDPIPFDAAINVLPKDWLDECSIHRRS